MTTLRALLLLLLPLQGLAVHEVFAQTARDDESSYTRKNSFGVFGEYSNDSSHIFLGEARGRKLLNFGAAYSRRLLARPGFEINYLAELRPVLFVGDPRVIEQATTTTSAGQVFSSTNVYTQSKQCFSNTITIDGMTFPPGTGTFTQVQTYRCGRQWTYGEGLSPLGVKFNLRTRKLVQPVFSLTAGYMFSTRPVPISQAGSFNYTFSLGAGVEFFRSQDRSASLFGSRSVRAEYRYNHISNAYTGSQNPGIDNGMVQITYAFGR